MARVRAIGAVLTTTAMLALMVGVVGVGPAAAATAISSCPYVITSPGTYVVTTNLNCPGYGISIESDDVTLNLGGHTLTGVGSDYGVYNDGYSRVTVMNGKLVNFGTGAYDNGGCGASDSNLWTHLTAAMNASYGFRGYEVRDGTYSFDVATHNGNDGFEFDQQDGCGILSFSHNLAQANGGIGFDTYAAFYESFPWEDSYCSSCPGSNFVWNRAVGNHDEGFLSDYDFNSVWQHNSASRNDEGIELENPGGVSAMYNQTFFNGGVGFDVDSNYGSYNVTAISYNTSNNNGLNGDSEGPGTGYSGFVANNPAPGVNNVAHGNYAGQCYNVSCK